MPGVIIETATRSGPAIFDAGAAGTYFVAGLTERGPVGEAIAIRSLADYERKLGSRVAYGFLFDDLTTFFEEGGTLAYVSRVVGPAATLGTLTLQDRAGAPVASLRLDALGAGAWSANVTAEVRDGTQANTFDLIIRHGDDEEVFFGLASPAAAVTALLGSNYVRGVNLGSASVAPSNNPAVLAATALSAGADDRASVVAATYVAALAEFGPELGAGAVAIPGQAGTAVAAGVQLHCEDNARLGLLAASAASSPTSMISQATTIRGATTQEEYLGLFGPWIVVPDGLGTGGERTIPPEGYVAAVRNRAHQTEGAWRAPAGALAEARYVLRTEREISRAEGDEMDRNGVSAIRNFPGGPRLYGWRSLSNDEANYSLLTGRDMLNFLAVEGEKRLEQYVFRSIDGGGRLLNELAAEIIGLVEPIRIRGGVFERRSADGASVIDPGYRVEVGPSVNTDQTLLQNKAVVALSVRVSPTGAFIQLLITKVGLTAAV